MATTASIQVHLFTNGDVQLDQLVNALDNNASPVVIYKQEIPPGVSTPIFNPFDLMPPGGPFFNLMNVMIQPDKMNTAPWTFSTLASPPAITFHPTNPMLLSITGLAIPLYIYHNAATPIAFQFTWV